MYAWAAGRCARSCWRRRVHLCREAERLSHPGPPSGAVALSLGLVLDALGQLVPTALVQKHSESSPMHSWCYKALVPALSDFAQVCTVGYPENGTRREAIGPVAGRLDTTSDRQRWQESAQLGGSALSGRLGLVPGGCARERWQLGRD